MTKIQSKIWSVGVTVTNKISDKLRDEKGAGHSLELAVGAVVGIVLLSIFAEAMFGVFSGKVIPGVLNIIDKIFGKSTIT